tara:strand:+ start:484 stop:1062 length:579 start_codon:yes stop_codon:yes gene_type:complete
MINIIRSVILSAIGLGLIGWISLYFIIYILILTPLSTGFGDSWFLEFAFNNLVQGENIAESGQDWADLAEWLYVLLAHMNIGLLSLTVAMSLIWSIASHFLNIDAPGKAKLYFIPWAIFTGVFIALVFGIVFYCTQTSQYEASDFLSGEGVFLINFVSLVFYFLMYFFGVLLGTARFARSSVLLANKLPGSL